jgi:hypothetical protein
MLLGNNKGVAYNIWGKYMRSYEALYKFLRDCQQHYLQSVPKVKRLRLVSQLTGGDKLLKNIFQFFHSRLDTEADSELVRIFVSWQNELPEFELLSPAVKGRLSLRLISPEEYIELFLLIPEARVMESKAVLCPLIPEGCKLYSANQPTVEVFRKSEIPMELRKVEASVTQLMPHLTRADRVSIIEAVLFTAKHLVDLRKGVPQTRMVMLYGRHFFQGGADAQSCDGVFVSWVQRAIGMIKDFCKHRPALDIRLRDIILMFESITQAYVVLRKAPITGKDEVRRLVSPYGSDMESCLSWNLLHYVVNAAAEILKRLDACGITEANKKLIVCDRYQRGDILPLRGWLSLINVWGDNHDIDSNADIALICRSQLLQNLFEVRFVFRGQHSELTKNIYEGILSCADYQVDFEDRGDMERVVDLFRTLIRNRWFVGLDQHDVSQFFELCHTKREAMLYARGTCLSDIFGDDQEERFSVTQFRSILGIYANNTNPGHALRRRGLINIEDYDPGYRLGKPGL